MTPTRADGFPGIHAVLYALFDQNERLDIAAMHEQTRRMLEVGVHGITVLGLATEASKLTTGEKRLLIEQTAGAINRAVPLSVTISGNSVAEQLALARHAALHGADWLILQPPAVGSFGADQYLDFFCRVADAVDLPMAIQNAPAYLGRGLSADDVARLTDRAPNFTHIKAEASAVEVAALIERTGGALTVLNGRAGLEMTDCLAAGCDGFILAPDLVDYGVAVFEAWQRGEADEANRLYLESLGAITFVMQSLESLITYGKRLYVARCGGLVHDRAPCVPPTAFGLDCVSRWAAQLRPFGACRQRRADQ